MLEFIRIQRFKSLRDASFPLAALNLFSGLNGMGKSSLIQTLLLLRQSHERGVLRTKGLLLKGDYVSLGTGKDILSENAEDESIAFILKSSSEQPQAFRFNYQANSDLQPSALHILAEESWPLFSRQFQYLSADRISPKPAYEVSDYYINDLNSLGNHGEYTAHYIAEKGPVINVHECLRHERAVSAKLLENLECWMSEISPGIRIHAEMQPTMNAVSLSYAFVQGGDLTADFKPQNVGFGLTFALPVLTAILRAQPGDMLIIENPEAHLHPGAQSLLGRLCAKAADMGVQLFIESHSDHFLNGVRVAVRKKILDADQVRIFYLERDAGKSHEVRVISPSLDSQGRLDLWPEGFFDEGDRQLEQLL